MHCGKIGRPVKQLFLAFLLFGAIAFVSLMPVSAQQQIHRNGFEGREIFWTRGEDNVRAEEKAHKLSSEHARSGVSSEFIQLNCPEAKTDNNYVNYWYSTQPAPIGDDLTASVFVKASRAGVRLQARVVLPKERNANRIDEPMTVVLNGDIYKQTRRWQKMEIPNPVKLLKDQQQLLRAQLQRDIDLTDAYIDRLILNLWTAPGDLDVYIDDLEIGPVKPVRPPTPAASPAGQPKKEEPFLKGRVPVTMEGNKLFVGGKPYFFRAIRYSDTPLKTLRDAGFNTLWFDLNTPADKVEEAISTHGFWIVPSLPLIGDLRPQTALTSRAPNDLATARDIEGLGVAISRFVSGDSVLFWDIGGALQVEKAKQLEQMSDAINRFDPGRPTGADIWDGFGTNSLFVKMVGTHRYPLLTSLELTKYRDWLIQRQRLAKSQTLHWTWVQTHIPEWQTQVIYGQSGTEAFTEPIGPQPEQIRLLTYLGLATGVKGLAFSSDRFLADSHQGRDRLLMLALLNQEIHMLEPLLLTLLDTPIVWIETSDKHVQAAVARSEKGVMVLPIWLGEGSQFVPGSGAVANLSMIVPMVPDGAHPWEITPARVQSLQYNSERVLGGTKITIPEFDLTSAIIFTSDLKPDGLVAKWQNHSRLVAQQSAQWAHDLAVVQLQKVRYTHNKLVALTPPIPPAFNADQFLQQSSQRIELSEKYAKERDYPNAYMEAVRALRPLRFLMKSHWDNAVKTLDLPSASPFAVSFYTLPKHWELHHEVKNMVLGANALRDGDFEAAAASPEFVPLSADELAAIKERTEKLQTPEEKAAAERTNRNKKDQPHQQHHPKLPGDPKSPAFFKPVRNPKNVGAPVSLLAGWTVQQQTLDPVEMSARLIPSERAKVPKPPKPKLKKDWYAPSNGLSTDPIDPPEPTLGKVVLALDIRPKVILSAKDDKAQPAPGALERTYLAVNSPAVRFQPGTWVRISGWIRLANPSVSSADGVLMFDNAGGEGMGVRLSDSEYWKRYHVYRKVPPSGVIWLTIAQTGLGTVYCDDFQIQPLEKGDLPPTTAQQ